MLIDPNPGDIFNAETIYRLADGTPLKFDQPVIVWEQTLTNTTATLLLSYATDDDKIATSRMGPFLATRQRHPGSPYESQAWEVAGMPNVAEVRISGFAGRSYKPNDPRSNSAAIMAGVYRQETESAQTGEAELREAVHQANGLKSAAKESVAARDAKIRAQVASGTSMYQVAKITGLSQQMIAKIVSQ